MHCRRRYEKLVAQKTADLSPSHLQVDTHLFAYCGVKYFGSLIVKQRRSQVKGYGCLFTCLTSRAIRYASDNRHLYQCFLSRRGPIVHFCNNGTNFVSVDKTLHEALRQRNQHKFEDFLLQKKNSIDFQSSKCQPHECFLRENDTVGQTNFNFIHDGMNS